MRALSLIQRPTPVDFFEDLWREFDRNVSAKAPAKTFSPRMDIDEKEGVYTILLDLPGLKKEDIKVDLHDSVLTVSGERVRAEGTGEKYSERSFGRFERSITLPTAVDAEKVEAKFEDGVLRLTLPQVAAAKPHTIKIQ